MKEIPVREVSEEEINRNIKQELHSSFTLKEIILFLVCFIIIFSLISLIFKSNDIEKQRQNILKQAETRLSLVDDNIQELTIRIRKETQIKLRLEKCIELNSNTGSLVDCDLFLNNFN